VFEDYCFLGYNAVVWREFDVLEGYVSSTFMVKE
jgi:hypothetical protein